MLWWCQCLFCLVTAYHQLAKYSEIGSLMIRCLIHNRILSMLASFEWITNWREWQFKCRYTVKCFHRVLKSLELLIPFSLNFSTILWRRQNSFRNCPKCAEKNNRPSLREVPVHIWSVMWSVMCFFCECWGLNSGPGACTARTLTYWATSPDSDLYYFKGNLDSLLFHSSNKLTTPLSRSVWLFHEQPGFIHDVIFAITRKWLLWRGKSLIVFQCTLAHNPSY